MALPSLALFVSAGLAVFLLPFGTHAERVRYDDEDVLSLEEDGSLKSKEQLPGDAFLEQHRAERLRRLAGTPLVPWPTILDQNYQNPHHLGAGSFGESWLATDADPESSMYGKKVVIKLLYVKDGGNGHPAHLTWSMVQYDMQLKKSTLEAARECDIASFLHDEAEKRQAKGAQRVMNCFGHNIPNSGEQVSHSALTAPLYLVLENCGADDLTKFMHKKAQLNQLSVPLVGGLFKQILEGLEFLSTLPVPWIHHDLKPDNIVVKTQDDGTYTVHLIDFGATTRATKDYVCEFTASTPTFAPQEWGSYTLECPSANFDYDPYCKTCSTSFDMFSAGAILLEMVTGSWVADLPHAWNHLTSRYHWQNLENLYVKNLGSLRSSIAASVHDPTTVAAYYSLMVSFWQPGSQSLAFFDKTMLTLSTLASSRPTAGALLSRDAFMLGIATPDDAETATPGMGLLPQVLAFTCPFKKEEVVEVYSSSFGGYVDATVTDVDSRGMVHVAYSNRVNVLACKSALIRKKASQPNQALQNLMATGFKPASGGQRRNFHAVAYENQPSCPGICSMCETAQTTNGAKAVYCWSMLIRAEQELQMYSCAKQYSATGVIGGRLHWKYLCVGRHWFG